MCYICYFGRCYGFRYFYVMYHIAWIGSSLIIPRCVWLGILRNTMKKLVDKKKFSRKGKRGKSGF